MSLVRFKWVVRHKDERWSVDISQVLSYSSLPCRVYHLLSFLRNLSPHTSPSQCFRYSSHYLSGASSQPLQKVRKLTGFLNTYPNPSWWLEETFSRPQLCSLALHSVYTSARFTHLTFSAWYSASYSWTRCSSISSASLWQMEILQEDCMKMREMGCVVSPKGSKTQSLDAWYQMDILEWSMELHKTTIARKVTPKEFRRQIWKTGGRILIMTVEVMCELILIYTK